MKLAIRQLDVVEGLEVLTKVVLQSGTVPNVGPVGVLEITQLLDQGGFDVLLSHRVRSGPWRGRDRSEDGNCASVRDAHRKLSAVRIFRLSLCEY